MQCVVSPLQKKKETVVQIEREREVVRGGEGSKTPYRLLRFVFLQCNWQTHTPPPSNHRPMPKKSKTHTYALNLVTLISKQIC